MESTDVGEEVLHGARIVETIAKHLFEIELEDGPNCFVRMKMMILFDYLEGAFLYVQEFSHNPNELGMYI